MSRTVKISTSEHPGPRLRPWNITLRTIVAGDTYPVKDILKAQHFEWIDKYAWWAKDEPVKPSFIKNGMEKHLVQLRDTLKQNGVAVARGPHTPMRTQQLDPGVRLMF